MASFRGALNTEMLFPDDSLLGNSTTAKHSLEMALKLDPGHTLANLTMGHLLADEGNGQQAIRFLERVSEEKPEDFEVRLKLAQVYLDLQSFDRALAQLKTAERLAPDNKRVFYLLARLYTRISDLTVAC